MNDMFTEQELLEQEELEHAQYHQQALDEQQELLSLEEREDKVLWETANNVAYATEYCGVDRVAQELIDNNPEVIEAILKQLRK